MNVTKSRRDLGQSLWLDTISRELLTSGTLIRYIDDWNVTGLTSNPTILDHAIGNSSAYDEAIKEKHRSGKSEEDILFDLAIEDIARAADLFRPIWDLSSGVDGWVSLEVSPLLTRDGPETLAAAKALRSRIRRPNAMIKIPGTPDGLPAVEAAIFAGVPVNVTLLFSREHYLAAAEAFLRGVERRIADGLTPVVGSVASVFVSRWDTAVRGTIPVAIEDRLGIAMGQRVYRAYRDLMDSPRWKRILEAGARPQRLLFASTGTKNPGVSDVLYLEALGLPHTVITVPENTLRAFAEHGTAGIPEAAIYGDCEDVLARFTEAGIDLNVLAEQLQHQGTAAFAKSWADLIAVIVAKGATPADSG